MGIRPGEGIAILLVLGAAVLLRIGGLAEKPLHNDEAVQGYKTGLLLESGDYRYDPTGHHGPTLYFLDLPIAWIRGESTLAELSETSLRLLPALAGCLTVLVALFFRPWIGAAPALLGAAFLALSPLQVYFSRHYIQEPLLTLFVLSGILTLLAWARRPGPVPAVLFGALAGLIVATKETSLIIAAALTIGLLTEVAINRDAARAWFDSLRRTSNPIRDLLLALAAALLVSFLFYSSFFANPGGLLDAFSGWLHGAGQASGGEHDKPSSYYLTLLIGSVSAGRLWSEFLILGLAVLAFSRTFFPSIRTTPAGRAIRLVGVTTVVQLVIYSLIPYKTPWLLMAPGAGLCLMAGAGAAALLAVFRRQHALAVPGVLLLALGLTHLGLQARRAGGLFATDPRNPWAYVQTVPDVLKIPRRITELTAVAGRPLQIKVIGPEYWPLPWYLRAESGVGYWNEVPAEPDADIIISAIEMDDELKPVLRSSYFTEYVGLRPGIVLFLRTETPLWDAYALTLD